LHDKIGVKFLSYSSLGLAYHETGQYKKEKRLYKKAEQVYPDDPAIIRRQAILSLSIGKTNAANEYINKYISLRKESRASEAVIATNLASIYSDAGILDKAEEYYRQALSLEPDNLDMMFIFNTSWFFIDKDRDINKGLEIIARALESNPDNWVYLGIKGVGLNKQGKNKEALELLEKSDSLRSGYYHPFSLHLEAAKKAVASQKNI
jgi:tetratricopeptide (TPR) repeat protein